MFFSFDGDRMRTTTGRNLAPSRPRRTGKRLKALISFSFVVVTLAACGADDDGPAPGTERGPCIEGACNAGLVCLSDLCVAPGTGPDAGADAGPDAAPLPPDAGIDPAVAFSDDVAPILDSACASCHATGQNGAPAFGTTYASAKAYVSERGALLGCTLGESLLFTIGEHADGAGPAFDAIEEATIRDFLDVHAAATPACAATAGRRARTGSIPVSIDDYLLDLSLLGPGLTDSRLTYSVSSEVGGVRIDDLTLVGGENGAFAINLVFESCEDGLAVTTPQFQGTRVRAGAGESVPIGTGTLLLPAAVGERLGVRADALIPSTLPGGAPADFGGACLAP